MSIFFPVNDSKKTSGPSLKTIRAQKANERNVAFTNAEKFLVADKYIMGEHCLSNDHCKVKIVLNENYTKRIVCINKDTHGKNSAVIALSKKMLKYYKVPLGDVIDDMFNKICNNFSGETKYEDVLNACHEGMLDIEESE